MAAHHHAIVSYPNQLVRDLQIRDRTMLKRLTLTSLLGLALLFSQGGVLLIAALCPHLRLAMPGCSSMSNQAAEIEHSQMAHHDMDQDNFSPVLATARDSNDTNVIQLQEGERPCSHCVIHAGAKSNPISVRTAETVKRSAELSVPQTVPARPPLGASDIAVLAAREHSPPGDGNRPKHVLLNTFRI